MLLVLSPLNFPGVKSRDDEAGGDRRHDWRGSAEKFMVAGMPFRETWKSSPMIGPEQYYTTVFAILCGVMEIEQFPGGSVHKVFGIIAVLAEGKY